MLVIVECMFPGEDTCRAKGEGQLGCASPPN